MIIIHGFIFVIQLYVATAQSIQLNEFLDFILQCGFPQPIIYQELYGFFYAETEQYAMSREEQAIFLAQLISSSRGFQNSEILNCRTSSFNYNAATSKTYLGRGFIHLIGYDQYEAASIDLGLGRYLLHEPKEVALNKRIAMRTSGWYWNNYVRQELYPINVVCGLAPFKFGVTTRAITARLVPPMCTGSPNELAKKRYECYLKIANITNIQDKALEEGCYN